MKNAHLKSFLRAILVSNGAKVRENGDQLLQVEAPPDLARQLGPKDLVLAFNQRGLQQNPQSELATVGNPVFDRILELALEAGRVGQRFLPIPKRRKRRPEPSKMLRITDPSLSLGKAIPTYSPVYYHLYKIRYSLEDAHDELDVISIDGVTREAEPQSPDLIDLWERLDPEPEPNRRIFPAFPIPEEVIHASLETLERRLRKRAAKLHMTSQKCLATETGSIKRYFEQLIEETKSAGRRWGGTLQAREEKIRVLQLDWKRRIEEAQEFWNPRIDIRLAAVGAVYRPRLSYPLKRKGDTGRARNVARICFDETDGYFLIPADQEGVSLLS